MSKSAQIASSNENNNKLILVNKSIQNSETAENEGRSSASPSTSNTSSSLVNGAKSPPITNNVNNILSHQQPHQHQHQAIPIYYPSNMLTPAGAPLALIDPNHHQSMLMQHAPLVHHHPYHNPHSHSMGHLQQQQQPPPPPSQPFSQAPFFNFIPILPPHVPQGPPMHQQPHPNSTTTITTNASTPTPGSSPNPPSSSSSSNVGTTSDNKQQPQYHQQFIDQQQVISPL